MIGNFLSGFENLGGKYVSWKNNHELNLVLNGESDLDIFIPFEHKPLFVDIAKRENWILVKNPIAEYPEVYHFYAIGKNLEVYHLHVYFKVITGESWLKEYIFPLDDFLIKNRVLHSSGIYILNGEAQSFLFVLRHFIKGGSFFSRFLYKKELPSYQQEWDLCKSKFTPSAQNTFIDFTKYLQGSGISDELSLPDIVVAKAVRDELAGFLRLPKSQLSLLRLESFGNRLLNKLFYKRKKVLYNGFILAFSGADGVGKSTMSDSIGNMYKSFLTVKRVQLGRPQSAWVDTIRKILRKPEKISIKTQSKSNKITFIKAFSATYLAYLRFKAAGKAQKYRQSNYLIISDRWPTLEYNKMDGPKLNIKNISGFYRILAKIEKYYYEKLTSSDLSIILTVPIDIAVERNRRRIKEDKETDEEIVERHLQNMSHNPKSKEIIRFDNNGDLVEKRYEIVQLIQQRLFVDI